MKKRLMALLLVGAMALGLCACGSAPASEEAAAPAAEDKTEAPAAEAEAEAEVEAADVADTASDASADGDYYMITFASGIQYWQGCWAGMQAAAAELGVNVQFTGATEADYVEETQVLEQVIAKNPAGILVTPANGDAMTDAINKAMDAGVPVVCFDSDSTKSNRYSYVGTNGYSAGATVAKEMAEAIGHKGSVAVVLFPGLQNQEDRAQGFEEYMAANEPDITVLERANGGQNENEAAAATASLITANPDIAGIFAVTAWTGLGAGQAIEEAGKTDSICCISFDTDEGVLDYIENGVLYGTCAQGTQQMGYWGLYFLYAINHETVIPGWADKGIAPVPPTVDTGVSIVKKGFTDSYR